MRIDLDIDYSVKLIAVRQETPAPASDIATSYLDTLTVIDMPDGFSDLTPVEQLTYIATELQKEGYGPKEMPEVGRT